MSRKNLIIISIFLLFILSVGMVSASDDVSFDSAQEDASIDSNLLGDAGIMENIVSEGENDDGDDADLDSNANSEIPVDEKTFDAIQNAIAHASENDTILLNGTYTATEKNMVIVNRAVTIQGVDNAILDGNGFKVRFRIDCPNVIFKGICFKNFSLEDNETGVIVTKNGGAVSNCSFINNTGIFSAIYATGGISNITNCSFSSNSNNIGTIFLNKASAEISNCRFDGNKIIYENDDYELVDGEMPYGLIASLKSKVILSNSDFYNNKMCGISAVLSNCSVTNCNFNKTESPVYLYNSNSTVKNSLFTALKSGITVCGGNNTIDACRFIKNTGTSILIDGELAYDASIYLICNSNFTDNTNKNGASAIHIFDSKASILNCNFRNNSVSADEGVIFLDTTNLVTVARNNITQKFKEVVVLNNALKPYPYVTFVVKNTFTTLYKSGKIFTGKVIYGFTKAPFKGFPGITYIQKGNKAYWEDFYTDKNGGFKINFSKYAVGTYKVTFALSPDGSEDLSWRGVRAKATVKITKGKTIVSAPYVTARVKRTKYFRVTVKNAVTKKVSPNLKLKLKVYTGIKYRIYTVKTNKKGIASFNTKNLKRGKHTVVISSGNSNYLVSKKSRITIKW